MSFITVEAVVLERGYGQEEFSVVACVAAWLSAWSTNDVPLSKVDLSLSNATRVDRFHSFMSILA